MSDITYVWEKRVGESKKEYKMFLHYMTFKTIKDIARMFNVSDRTVYRARKTWEWEKRIRAYEAFHSSTGHPDDMEIIPSENKPVLINKPEIKYEIPNISIENPLKDIARAELKMYFDFKKAAEKINKRVIEDSYIPCRDELGLIKLAQDQTNIVTRILNMINLEEQNKEETVDFSKFTDEEFEQIVELSKKVS